MVAREGNECNVYNIYCLNWNSEIFIVLGIAI
jgi:hypothetical protein